MLKLLLDEHISPAVASGIRRRKSGIVVHAMTEWREGALLGQDDDRCLREAAVEGLTLVTYDRRTIPILLKSWAEQGEHHSGVIFVDERTISPADLGGLTRSLLEILGLTQEWDWTDRVCFLRRE